MADASGQVAFSFPPSWLFQFPPDPSPPSLPPAANQHSISAPFGINPTLYHAVLQPAVPITFAIGYVTCVKIANSFNRKRGNKPWSISKTNAFYYFVVLHNIGLALYSAVTCAAMARALYVSVPSPFGSAGLPGTLDSLCKLHGPRGLGDAVYYDTAAGSWISKNRLVHLAANNLTPDPTDVGRIWNEGLAFWGWFFYLSKFYEVFDTIIILAKGKRSSTLQTYHHAGAMMCMWAGMRYRGPPIWMFALVNAGIHTIMYTYYTLSAVGIRVPKAVKQLITTAQIMQFLVGITFAGAHFFVSYAVPVSVPYSVASAAAGAASSASSAASVVRGLVNSQSASSLAASATGGETVAWLKKFALRAANFEGPAQNVQNHAESKLGTEIVGAAHKLEQVRYRDEHQMIHCLETSGEGFAIWLNVVYLAPLTFLFARFFVKSYILAPPPKTARQRRVSDSAMSAARKTSDAIEKFGRSIEDTIGSFGEQTRDNVGVLDSRDAKRKVRVLIQETATTHDAGEAIEDDDVSSKAGRKGGATTYAGAVKEDLKSAKRANGSTSRDIDQTDPLQKPNK
ncbi:hypothetical protein FH972_025650 [Carpinus fangiana]|uniref:Very-long-chain 3-oxoacyl-CoA synthase n=1 Tax=Carpinus fangiana TaxID=176857 RepID=A0A5N6L1L9_9ROSI|nr:hypothetical protein FH972_025650 [Carpinus fangiana]